MKGILCEKARGFPIIKLFVLSTNMSNLYKRYFKKSEVVLRGAKAQHTVKKKKKRVPIGRSMSRMLVLKAVTYSI